MLLLLLLVVIIILSLCYVVRRAVAIQINQSIIPRMFMHGSFFDILIRRSIGNEAG